jgi:hypothetical protein
VLVTGSDTSPTRPTECRDEPRSPGGKSCSDPRCLLIIRVFRRQLRSPRPTSQLATTVRPAVANPARFRPTRIGRRACPRITKLNWSTQRRPRRSQPPLHPPPQRNGLHTKAVRPHRSCMARTCTRSPGLSERVKQSSTIRSSTRARRDARAMASGATSEKVSVVSAAGRLDEVSSDRPMGRSPPGPPPGKRSESTAWWNAMHAGEQSGVASQLLSISASSGQAPPHAAELQECSLRTRTFTVIVVPFGSPCHRFRPRYASATDCQV